MKWTMPGTADLLNIGQARLKEWVGKGYIIPDVPSMGSGRPAQYDINNLYEVKILEHLTDRGLARDKGGQIINSLNKDKALKSDFLGVFNDGKKIECRYYNDMGNVMLDSKIKDIIFVNLKAIRAEVDRLTDE